MLLSHASRALIVRFLITVFAVTLVSLGLVASASAQPDNVFLGNGQDGAVTVNTNGPHYPNTVAPVTGAVSAGATSLVRGTTRGGTGTGAVNFANNRLVIVLQTTGWTGTATSGSQSAVNMTGSQVGKWEFARISTVSGSTLNFTEGLINSYASGTAQVVAVPEYTDYSITGNNRVVRATPWDGTSGGVLATLASGTVNIANASSSFHADTSGFRGGVSYNENAGGTTGCPSNLLDGNRDGGQPTAMKGEGIYPQAFSTTTPSTNDIFEGRGNYLNAGGGGNCFNAGGGGGSNGGAGGVGGNSLVNYTDGNQAVGGLGGASLTYNAFERAVFGGGGGAGERNNGGSGNGGIGGGMVLLRGNTLTGNGVIRANGGAGEDGDDDGTPYDGAGGGGAGGVILMRFAAAVNCDNVYANGGAGGNNSDFAGYNWTPGGGGGGGRVYVQGTSIEASCARQGNAGAAGSNGGNAYGAAAGSAGSVTNNTTALATPTITLANPANGSYTTSTTPTVSGTATANSTVYIYIDGTLNGTATTNGSGNWTYSSTTLGQGSHTVRAYSEVAGIASAYTSTNSFTVDSVAPAVSISSPTAGQWLQTATTAVAFTVTETNQSTTECRIDTGTWTACTTGWTTPSMTAGSHSIQVRHTDLAGNVGSSAVTVNVDLTNPVVTISSPAAASYTNDTTPDITFSVTETNTGTTECRVDGGSWGACSSPWTTPVLSNASHTVEVRHTDLSGRVGSASRTFTVDNVNPSVSISSPTAGQWLQTATTAVAFTVTETNQSATECRIDTGTWTACSTGWTTPSMTAGSHSIQVRHTDLAGNVGSSAVTVNVDLTDPVVSISSPAAASYTNDTTPDITFSVTETNSGTTECRVDGGSWGACSSPWTTPTLTNASHTVEIRHTDLSGRVGSASRTFTVDNVLPVVAITGPTNGSYVQTATPVLNFNVTETNAGTSECRVDSGSWTTCTSGWTPPALTAGVHSLSVRHTDLAGNVSTVQSTSITVDLTDPVVSISSPAAASFTNDTTPDITFSVTETNSGTTECRVDGGSWGACSSPWTTPTLTSASHTVEVRHTDLSGRVGSASRTFTVDTDVPVVSISTPANGSLTNNNTPTVNFSVTETNLGTSECSIDGSSWTSCTSGWVTPTLADGSRTVYVRHTDQAGNVGQAQHTFTVDTTAPDAPTLSDTPDDPTNDNSASITVTPAEPGGTVECRLDGGAWGACGPLSGLSDGSHTYEARQTDDAGNIGAVASYTWEVDTAAPPAPTVNGPSGTSASETEEISFTDTEPGVTFYCSLDGAPPTVCTSPLTVGPLTDGPHTFDVYVEDDAGNQSPVTSINWITDLSGYVASIDDAPASPSSDTTPEIDFSATLSGSTFHCSIDGGAVYTCTAPDELGPLSDGSHTFEVYATRGGQTTPTVGHTWTVDTTAPSLDVTAPTEGATTGPDVDVEFDATDAVGPVTYTCSVDGGPASPCTSPLELTGLSDGPHSVTVVATDGANNTVPVVRSWNVDATAPETTIDSSPDADTNDTGAEFTFSSNESGTFQCRLDGGAWTSCSSPDSFTVAEGPHTFEVRAIDAVGNVDQSPASYSWNVDTTTPAAPVISGPASIVTDEPEQQLTGTAEPFSYVQLFVDGSPVGTPVQADVDGNWTFTFTSPNELPEGVNTIHATSTDAAGNESVASNEVEVTVDTTNPVVTIDSPADGATVNSSTITFSGVDDTALTYECSFDNGNTFESCTSPWSPTFVDGQTYDVIVVATDAAGNFAQDNITVTYDITAPDAPEITDPSGAASYNTTTPTISGTAEANSTVTVFVDGAEHGTTTADGSGNWSYDFSSDPLDEQPAAYVVHVTATDAAGNESVASDSRALTIDLTAPADPTITAPVDGSTTSNATPTITGTAEANSTVHVWLDGNEYDVTADGSGNWSLVAPSLSDGPHSVYAISEDAAGNTSGNSATVNFTVDTSLPSVVISAPSDFALLNDNDVTVEFDGTDNGSLTYTCTLNATPVVCAEPSVTFTDLSDGDYTFVVSVLDDATNAASATVHFTVDTTAPNAPAIDEPLDGAQLDNGGVTVSGTAEPDSTITLTLNGNPLPAVITTDGNGDWTYTFSPDLAEGDYTVSATATDAAGNESAASNEVDFTVDTTAPNAPVVDEPADGSFTDDTTPTISGTAEPNSTVEITVDGNSIGTVTADGNGDWSIVPGSPLSEGSHTVSATATDAAGNESAASSTNTFTVDSTDPVVTVTGPANGSTTADDTPQVAFNVTDATAVTTTCTVDGGTPFACTSGDDLPALSDGSHTVVVTATDAAGNTDTDSTTFTVDTTAPTATIDDAPSSPDNDSTPTFEFSANEGGSTFECSVDGGPWTSCTSPFTTGTLTDGPHTFSVRATDGAGNIGTPVDHNWTVDTTAPNAPAIVTPASPHVTSDNTPTISGTAEPDSTVMLFDGITFLGSTTADGSGDWSFTPASPLADGDYEITATATDEAGNESDPSNQLDLEIDASAPVTTIDVAPNSPSSDSTPTFEFSSNESGSTFECRVDGGVWDSCTSPFTTDTLSDGVHTFEVRATDGNGNTDATPAVHNWTIDTTPPAVPVITAPVDGTVTNDSTPTVSGTGDAGSQINVFVDGNLACTATVTGGGTWSCNVSPALADGDHEITATSEDALGNESAATGVVDITVDTTPPDGTVTQGGTPENPTFDISSDDPSATVSCALAPGGSIPCTPPTYIPSGLAPGDYTLTVTFTDGAGNSTVRAINFRIPGPNIPPVVPPQADPTACFAKGVTIYNMKVKGNKMTISGFARTSYAGKEVTINFQPTKSRVIGRTTVKADGSFTATVPAPGAKLRKKANTRYRANVPGESSLWFKFDRRMGSNEATYSGGSLKVSGFLTKPLDPKSVLTITARTGCNEPWKKIGTAKIGRTGAFSASIPYQPTTGVAFVRMYAKVRKTAKGKATLTTYSFVIPVVTGN